MKRRWLCVLLAALLIWAALGVPALAAEDGHSLTLSLAPDGAGLAGVEFSLYRVAEVHTDQVSFTPLPPYRDYHVLQNTAADFLTRAATLQTYVERDRLPADAVAVTDKTGKVVFSGLPQGLYLVLGARSRRDGTVYTPVPCLLSLPSTQDGLSWTHDLSAEMKYTQTSSSSDPGVTPAPSEPPSPSSSPEPVQTTRLRVLKVWSDAGHEELRPAGVDVDLLRDGAVYDTAVLSPANSWRYEWTGLDAARQWQVVEREDPSYLPALTQSEQTHVITNTYLEDLEDPDVPLLEDPDVPLAQEPVLPAPSDVPDGPGAVMSGETLPQTGLVWWPVPLLSILGLALILLGLIRRRGGREHEE